MTTVSRARLVTWGPFPPWRLVAKGPKKDLWNLKVFTSVSIRKCHVGMWKQICSSSSLFISFFFQILVTLNPTKPIWNDIFDWFYVFVFTTIWDDYGFCSSLLWILSIRWKTDWSDRNRLQPAKPETDNPKPANGRWRLGWFGVFHPTKPGSATRTRPHPTGGQPYFLWLVDIFWKVNIFFSS